MRGDGRGRWFGLLAISLGVAMIIVDATIVNVAVPQIIRGPGHHLHRRAVGAGGVHPGLRGAAAGRRPHRRPGRAAADVPGRRRASSSSPASLAALRRLRRDADRRPGVQGIGGAMMLPTSLSLLNANFTGRERGIAFAVWGSTIGGAAALGPLLGGWLTTAYSWRWAFGINVPVGIAVVVATLVLVAESRDDRRPSGASTWSARCCRWSA